MMLYRIMFGSVSYFLFAVTVVCVMAKASVCPHISDDVSMHVVVKGGIFEFIGLGRTKNRIMMCELRQYWFHNILM